MKAEARKIAILVVDILIEVGDVETESNQRSCVAKNVSTSKQSQEGNRGTD